MRFFEVAAPRLKLSATRRFRKEFAQFARANSSLEDLLRDFLEFKLSHPTESWGAKDFPFKGNGSLHGYQHVHLFHGKVIVVYDIDQGSLRLLSCVEHKATEGKNATALGHYLDSLGDSSHEPFSVARPREAEPALTKEQMSELEALMWEMAVQDRDILEQTKQGNLDGLMEFMVLTVEAKPETIVKAFGGAANLSKVAARILSQTA